jgi:hypothetical protein
MSYLRSFLKRAQNRATTERDLWRWRQQLASMRDTAPNALPTRSVLFSELMTITATAKMESIIAGLLRTKGYRAIVLLERPDRPVEQIFLSSVPDAEFVYLSEAISAEQQDVANREAGKIIAGVQSLQDIIDLEIDGFRVGRNVLSIVLRQFRLGCLVNDSAEQRAAVHYTLGRSLAVKTFTQRFLAERKPDIAIFNERGYTPAGEVFDGCTLSGVDTIQWCGGPQADRLLYRRYRSENRADHPLTFCDETWRSIKRMPWTQDNDRAVVDRIADEYISGTWCSKQRLQDGREIVDAEYIRRNMGLDPEKKTAIIFSHIFYDAAFFYGKNLFGNYERWLIEAVRSAIANKNLNWIVKVHPSNVWRSQMDGAQMAQLEAAAIGKHLGALPSHVKLMAADTKISTFSLFDVADYGLTVRGTIGLELPCFGIPVVTAGTGRYSGRGFTIDPATRDEYRALLARLHEIPRLNDDAIRLARLHYFATFELMPMRMRSVVLDFFAKRKASGVFMSDVSLRQPADERLLETDDVGRLINWMTETDLPELLTRDIQNGQTH